MAGLPISEMQARRVAEWMVSNFDDKLASAVTGTIFKKKHLCAIVCKETAFVWLGWVRRGISTDEILARCVFDASGDASGTRRNAFPKNTSKFRQKFGDAFTNMLIKEANLTRRLRNYPDKQWVYKGYGIFQYDLQHIQTDEIFFREKKWNSFDVCLAKAMTELKAKFAATGDLWNAIKAYNGSGPKAEEYKRHVKTFTTFCAPVTGE